MFSIVSIELFEEINYSCLDTFLEWSKVIDQYT